MLIDRRMVVIGVTLSTLFVSLVLNFLIPFWDVAENLQWISILHYYAPYHILKDGTINFTNVLVLLGIAIICWTSALLIFQRRDLAAV